MNKVKIEAKAIPVKMVGVALEIVTHEEPDIVVTIEMDDANIVAINQSVEPVETVEIKRDINQPYSGPDILKPICAQDIL